MTSYLQRQRKGELQEMATLAGVPSPNGLLKEDLIAALQQRLNASPAEFQKVPQLKEYYERGGSPSKQRAAAATATSDGEAVAKPRRRKTIKKEDLETPEEDITKSLVKTPARAVQKVVDQVRMSDRMVFPPSPAVVADAIERQTAVVTTKVGAFMDRSGVSEAADFMREMLSSVHGIETVITLIEALGLQRETLPWTTSLTLPPIRFIKSEESIVFLPNLFEILTAKFWNTSLLWLTTTAMLPALFGYFFNLTLHGGRTGLQTRSSGKKPQHTVDPLTFNVTKALLSWLIYSQGIRFGFLANETVDRVNVAVFGGVQGLMIGAAIGGLASVYDAVLKK